MCNQVDDMVVIPQEKGPFSNLKQSNFLDSNLR